MRERESVERESWEWSLEALDEKEIGTRRALANVLRPWLDGLERGGEIKKKRKDRDETEGEREERRSVDVGYRRWRIVRGGKAAERVDAHY